MQWAEFSTWWVDQSLDSLHHDWSQLGAFPNKSPTSQLIDPEALIAATWTVGRMDGRLFDTALQWAEEHTALLDRIRLKACLELMGPETRAVGLAWWDWMGDGIGQPPKLNATLEQPAALFGMNNELVGPHNNADFSARKILRGQISTNDGALRSPDFGAQSMGRFVVRAAMGASARTEVITLLASAGEHDTLQLSNESLYGRRSIQLIVNDLCRVGLAVTSRGRVAPTERLVRVQAAFGLATDFRSDVLRAKIFEVLWTVSARIKRTNPSAAIRRSLLRDAADLVNASMDAHRIQPVLLGAQPSEESILDTLARQLRTALGLPR